MPEPQLRQIGSTNLKSRCACVFRVTIEAILLISIGELRICASDPKAEGHVLDDVTDSVSPSVGDPKTEQFLRLLGAHERSLFAYVYAIAPNWQDAEEIMQRVR